MDIEKEREAFEGVFPCSVGTALNEYGHYESKINQQDAMIQNISWVVWQAAKAQAVPGWISVEDSLPPVDETVLVCWDYAPDIEPEKEYTTKDENLDEYWPNCQDEPPTHWMPLPKVVKAQEPAND